MRIYNLSFDLINPFNQTVTITSMDTCTPFRPHAFVFPNHSNPNFLLSYFPFGWGQMITPHYFSPDIGHYATQFYFNGSNVPDGDYYFEVALRGFISNPINTPFYPSSMCCNY